jgi:hypothetical protein
LPVMESPLPVCAQSGWGDGGWWAGGDAVLVCTVGRRPPCFPEARLSQSPRAAAPAAPPVEIGGGGAARGCGGGAGAGADGTCSIVQHASFALQRRPSTSASSCAARSAMRTARALASLRTSSRSTFKTPARLRACTPRASRWIRTAASESSRVCVLASARAPPPPPACLQLRTMVGSASRASIRSALCIITGLLVHKPAPRPSASSSSSMRRSASSILSLAAARRPCSSSAAWPRNRIDITRHGLGTLPTVSRRKVQSRPTRKSRRRAGRGWVQTHAPGARTRRR